MKRSLLLMTLLLWDGMNLSAFGSGLLRASTP
ncbi:MAG: hypothetical protein GPOALKHO_000369 [Sodalis sp.]|nr:MAG: hypothetical protein GPOALKHO_000369 [Sodalis sp.]